MDKTIAVERDYVAGFLDVRLGANPENRLLTGPSAEYPDVGITTQPEAQCGAANSSLKH